MTTATFFVEDIGLSAMVQRQEKSLVGAQGSTFFSLSQDSMLTYLLYWVVACLHWMVQVIIIQLVCILARLSTNLITYYYSRSTLEYSYYYSS